MKITRIYFLFLIAFVSIQSTDKLYAQTYVQLVDFADQKVMEGDYYYAIQYYQKAMDFDSNSVEILWKYAEALRLYKDYKKSRILLLQSLS